MNLEAIYNSDDWITLEGAIELLQLKNSFSRKELIKAYEHLAYKYHPSNPQHRHNVERFIQIFLAYDLLLKIIDFNSAPRKSRADIYTIWLNEDKIFAVDMAVKICRLNRRQFEKLMFRTFNKVIQFVYWILMILILFGLVYPMRLYMKGEIPLGGLMMMTTLVSLPFFLWVRKIIKDEDNLVNSVKDYQLNRKRYKKKYSKPAYGKEAVKIRKPNSKSLVQKKLRP